MRLDSDNSGPGVGPVIANALFVSSAFVLSSDLSCFTSCLVPSFLSEFMGWASRPMAERIVGFGNGKMNLKPLLLLPMLVLQVSILEKLLIGIRARKKLHTQKMLRKAKA